jgi:ABC-type lipoprotein export system ATPase subunit
MIEAADLTFGYRRGQPVVRDWSATIERGEAVAIVGASGSGKSTLLYVLGTLVRPWSGSLRLDGKRIDGLGDAGRSDVRASRIGFVFQDAILDQRRTIVDNVIEGSVYRGDDRRAAIRRAQALLERTNVRVEGTRRAMDLSGGQAQRIALCRALLDAPPILLADEPTGNLDRDNGQAVEEALIEHARGGAAVVIVTHDERLAARCDRTYRL